MAEKEKTIGQSVKDILWTQNKEVAKDVWNIAKRIGWAFLGVLGVKKSEKRH